MNIKGINIHAFKNSNSQGDIFVLFDLWFNVSVNKYMYGHVEMVS